MDPQIKALLSSRPPKYDGQDHQATWARFYPLEGQGTLMFNLDRSTPFTIVISPADPKPPPSSCVHTPGYIALEIGEDIAEFVCCKPDGQREVLVKTTLTQQAGYVPDRITTYWFSFDHNNLVIKYGKGYTMEQTTLMSHYFIPEDADEKQSEAIRDEMSFIFGPTVKKVVLLYDIAPLPLLKKLYSAIASGQCASKLTAAVSKELHKVGTKGKLQIVESLVSDIMTATSDSGNQGILEVEKKVDFYNFPLVTNPPPFVLDSSEVTLYSLSLDLYTFSASLPSTCVELYSNVKNCDLNYSPTPEQYKLSDAIGYSLNTEGCLLYETVKNKQGEFGPDTKNQVYLRVTCGPQKGQSPGVPYVIEIWPKGCGSPIHNHGNTYAVIHVLYGGLDITIFNKDLNPPDGQAPKELKNFSVKKGDITWISPNWYQTHQLWNTTDDYCATIQCYQYGDNNKISWPYFDYRSTTDQIDEFLPNSDFGFLEMRESVMEEYRKHMESLKK